MEITAKPFEALDAAKQADGLIPAIIQDARTLRVLMLGYMNGRLTKRAFQKAASPFTAARAAPLDKRRNERQLPRHRIGHGRLRQRHAPHTCHPPRPDLPHRSGELLRRGRGGPEGFIRYLQGVIQRRHAEMPRAPTRANSSTAAVNKIAQKVGEEAVETVIEAVAGNREAMVYEASDLIYHLLVLLEATGCSIANLEAELARRHS